MSYGLCVLPSDDRFYEDWRYEDRVYFRIDLVHDAQPTSLVRVVNHVQERPRLLWCIRVECLLDDLD